ncbi:hypothetical protein BGX34_004473 [Mortierella sp. NVP85]|nr:hypothetical protein BGX34_004473 [Mortierella sp. NVP85]
MTNDVSIFDIPHVIERIGSYLDHEDRLSCALVSKAFHKEFNRLLWRELVLCRKSFIKPGVDPRIEPDRVRAIRTNTQWTRKISVDTQCREGVLPLLAESCSSLTELKIYVSREQDEPHGTLFQPIVELINRNTQLKTCSFIRYASLSRGSLTKLARAFSQSPCLTDLVLRFHIILPPHGWLQCVLQNLPKTLKSLSLEWRKQRDGYVSTAFPVQDWPETYPSLEVAKLMVTLTEVEEHSLTQFLDRCPALKECNVPRMASSQSLSRFIGHLGGRRFPFSLIKLNCHMWDEMNEHQWRALLSASKDHTRAFVIGLEFSTALKRNFIREMTEYWSQTLESLEFYNTNLIAGPDIQLIMTSCPKLRKFCCICFGVQLIHSSQDDSVSVPGLRVVATDENGTYNDVMTDWVCLDMEELKLTFSDGRTTSSTEPILSQQKQCIAKGTERVYEQLGRLTKLKELTIGWCSGNASSKEASLDMSFQSGIEHMEPLKSLRMISISHLPVVNIDLGEADWMLRSWPQLRKITGLKYRYRISRKGAEEPGYLGLFRSKRPWLDIS